MKDTTAELTVLHAFLGKQFRATMFGYTYDWLAGDTVMFDTFGDPFVWCVPIRRISGKRGHIRAAHIFSARDLPK